MLDTGNAGQGSNTVGIDHPGDRRTGRAKGDQPRLLQREAMFAELRQILEGTWAHPRCSIMFEGLPGMGKSAALDATFAMARNFGVRVGSARCDAAESTTPFEAVRQVFASLLGHSALFDQQLNDGGDLARSVLRTGHAADHDAVDVYHSLLSLLDGMGSDPVMIGVDDVQWADPMSLGWFQFLARRLQAVPVHLVLTMRTTRGAQPSAGGPLVLGPTMRRFVIQPLSIEATKSMIDGHFGASCDSTFAAAAHDLSGGSPGLLARMLNALDQTGIPAAHLTSSDLEGLESSISARAVMSRAASLGFGAREFVEAVAILGPSDIRVVGSVAGVDHERAARLTDDLADLGVLGWGRPIDFAHKLQRQFVAAEIAPTRRAQTHAAAARVLALFGRSITEIASHIIETDPAGDEATTAFLIDAARHQIGAAYFVDADRLLERAEHEAPTNLLRAEVALLCAEVDGRLGRAGVVEHLKRAAHFGLDPVILAETALDIVDRRHDVQSSSAILSMVQSVRGELEIEHSPTARRLELVESVCLPATERPHRDPQVAEHLAGVDSSITEDLFSIEQSLRAAAQMRMTYADLLESLRTLLTTEVLRPAGFVHSVIVGAALHALVRIGAHEIADPLLRSAINESGGSSGHYAASGYSVILAESLAMQGKVIAADQLVRQLNGEPGSALRQCIVMERRWFAALRERGNHGADAASFAVKMAAPGLSDLGFSASMLLAETSARVRLLEGDWLGVLATLDRLNAIADSVSVKNPAFVPWRVARCAALAELGRFEEGIALAEENLELARSFGCPVTIAEALACVAKFEPPVAQVGLLQDAIQMLSGTSAELLRCNLLIDLGFARHHAGDAAEARSALREGADQATRLGASRLAGVAGRGLLACGARPRRLHASGRESLTPAELRVVRLAADGQTNSAIAEALFINMKTVESHLTRAYRKLGITDRAELAEALRSHPDSGYGIPRSANAAATPRHT